MTSQDLPSDQKPLTTAALPGGVRTLLRRAGHFARRQWLAWRVRRAVGRRDAAEADAFFAALLASSADDSRQAALLISATLHSARAAEVRGKWVAACRLWTWYARASGDFYKAGRNMIRCARSTTKTRNDRMAVVEALQCWQSLASIEPNSSDARQGIAWCHAALARLAEQTPDWRDARAHWSALLEIAPDDPAGIAGLRRALDAEAASAPEKAERTRVLHEQLKRVTGPEYSAQCTAAKLLLEADAPEPALGFVERALQQGRGPEALVLLVRGRVATGRFEEAAAALAEFVNVGDLASIPAVDLRALLSNLPPQRLSAQTITRMAVRSQHDALTQIALVPHLIAHDLRAEIAAVADAAAAGNSAWPEVLVLETVRYLLGAEERDRALRLLARFSATPNVARAFSAVANVYPADQLDDVVTGAAALSQDAGFPSWLALVEYHANNGDYGHATAILARIDAAGAAERLYRHDGERLGAVVAQIAVDADSETAQRLARFASTLLPENTRAFFAGPGFAKLCEELDSASQFQNAPESSRTGRLREHYFAHHMERREKQPADSFTSDFAFCEAVLRYFAAMARLRPVERIPVSAELRDRLAQPSLRLGREGGADVLMAYAILRDRLDCDLKSADLFEQLAGWFVGRFMPDHHVPSCCIGPDVLAHFNTVEVDHPNIGVAITRFANFLRAGSQEFTARYRPENSLDALLFSLEALSTLPGHLHCRPFFAAMLRERRGLVDQCIAFLSGNEEVPFSRILRGETVGTDVRKIAEPDYAIPQEVLLIGHAGEGTGLTRNFRMLSNGLTGDDIALTTLFYEAEPEEFAESLKRWHDSCRARPIVVAAVNAHDIPALFIRDPHGVLANSHVVSFFLWETSQAPRVQHLGIGLVDEIWTPTRYVAGVYSGFAPTYVVGKGLFTSDAAVPIRGRVPGPLRFLTVFDFHSSIERKNPLAAALAFRQAFPNGEDVELIVKASNVNPQHPGNAFGQWERLCAAAAQDSRIRIVTERYSEEQMNALIAQVSCVVSLHRSEGFGYVMSDAMALGIPVIATAHSGNLDFCDAETSFPVACRLVPVNALGAHWEGEGAEWAEPDIDSAAAQMRRVYEDYPAALSVAAAGQRAILAKYATTAFAANLRARIAAIRGTGHGVDRSRGAVQ